MPKLEVVDQGSVCHKCGHFTAPHYLMPVVVHPGKLKLGCRFLQHWCVECIAKSKPGDCKPAPTIGELTLYGKLRQDWEKVSVGRK